MGVCAVRSEMVVSVGMRDRMRVDVAAVEMREGVLVRMGAAMSRAIMPMTNGMSRRVSGADALRSWVFRSERIAMPIPAPR